MPWSLHERHHHCLCMSASYLREVRTALGTSTWLSHSVAEPLHVVVCGGMYPLQGVPCRRYRHTAAADDRYWSLHPVGSPCIGQPYTSRGTGDCCCNDQIICRSGLSRLPYSVAPPRNSGDHAWAVSGTGSAKVDFQENYVIVSASGTVQAWEDYPAIQSPEFYIPANINATINSSGTIYAREVWPITYDCELTMYLENEKLTSRKVSNTSGVDYSFTINDKTLTNSSKKVRFSTDGRTRLSGYAYVRNVSVTYR